jgi:hypothetical protein
MLSTIFLRLPNRLKDDGLVGSVKTGMDVSQPGKQKPVSGHRIVDAGSTKDDASECPESQGTSLRLATRPWLISTGEYGGSGPPGKARGPGRRGKNNEQRHKGPAAGSDHSVSRVGGNPYGTSNFIVEEAVIDMRNNNETPPPPLSSRSYSGKFVVRVPPEVHRELALKAAEAGISLNRLISSKLSNSKFP